MEVEELDNVNDSAINDTNAVKSKHDGNSDEGQGRKENERGPSPKNDDVLPLLAVEQVAHVNSQNTIERGKNSTNYSLSDRDDQNVHPSSQQVNTSPSSDKQQIQPGVRPSPPPEYDPKPMIDANNFWLTNNYKKVVKKVDDGAKLCDDMAKMLQERAEIESLYGNKLKAWNKKWSDTFSKGGEYGSLLGALKDGLEESTEIANVHVAVQSKLFETVQHIQDWKSDSYHKGIMGWKETKKCDEGFSKAHKPWLKKYDDTIKNMKAYHSSRQLLDITTEQEKEVKANVETTTQDQLTKTQTKKKKAELDVETTRDKYKESIRDISNYNPKYRDDMEYEFEKWQAFEYKRRDFMKEKLKESCDCLNIVRFFATYERIYTELDRIYNAVDSTKDMEWYRRHFGPDMPFVTLEYVEYDPNTMIQDQGPSKQENSMKQGNGEERTPSGGKKSKVCTTL